MSSTDSASTCAASWRISSRASGLLSVMISIRSPSAMGAERSRSSPPTLSASAAFARPGPIAAAASAPVASDSSSSSESSGSLTLITRLRLTVGVHTQLAGMRNSPAVHQLREPMGMGRPRSLACALVALAFVAVTTPATPAFAAKGKHHDVHRFGTRPLGPGAKGKDVRYLQRALTRLGVATSVDGVFGNGTRPSGESFEQQRGWAVNGVVSKKDAKRIKKLLAKSRVTGGYFVEGYVNPTLDLSSRKAGTAKIKLLNASGDPIESSQVTFGGAESQSFAWNGTVASAVAPDGIYQLRLADPGTAGASVTGGQMQPFEMHLHQFPVPGSHTYGGADGRFGAPRSGHIHQGQDLPAACGEKLYVFEKGQVRVNAFQAGGAGYYVVIHGLITGTDAVYMHLQAPSWAPAGTSVTAGQQIGKVGATGDAQGCHLHFERWSAPGWFVGGAAYDPLPELQYWDSYS